MMNKMMKLMLIAVFSVAILCAGGLKKVEALSIIVIDDSSTVGVFDVIVADNTDANVSVAVPGGTALTTHADMNPTVGSTFFAGSIGAFGFSTASGISDHVFGNGRLRLHGATGISTGGGTLDFWFSDNTFLIPALVPGVVDTNAVNTDGTVATSSWIDPGDFLFGTTGTAFALPTSGPLGPGAFVDTSSLSFDPGLTAPFSLTKNVTIVHTRAGQVSSFDNDLIATPEPGTIALLGIGLAGIVGLGVRRRMKTRNQTG